MAAFTIYHCILSFHLLLLCFLTLTAIPISSFSDQTLNSNDFDPEIGFLGDAEVVNAGSHVQLTRPFASSSGLLFHKQPFKFIEGNVTEPTAFSTEFSFSITPGSAGSIVLALVPHKFASKFVGLGSFERLGENEYLGIEFDTKLDGKLGDSDANHVGTDIRSHVSVNVGNISSIRSVLNNGEKLKSWVDYDPSSKRLEIRLSKFGEQRPSNPILACSIDFIEMWGDEDVFVGLVSTNNNTSQTTSVYSWRFRLRKFPNWMHSLPADPRGYVGEGSESSRVHESNFCPSKILAGLIFGTGCGALLAFVVLFVWAIVIGRQTALPVESPLHPIDHKYQKINVVVDKDPEEFKT